MQRVLIFALLTVMLAHTRFGFAQHAPGIGYLFPPGAQLGQSVDVVLGGYDWTPDMQVFVHDQRIQLELLDVPGPIIVPEPPYWFGKKSRRSPFPLPREVKARLTIPADMPPGIVTWQAANANGATATGRFVVLDSAHVVEAEDNGTSESAVQVLPPLPVCVSGQIKRVQDVDRFAFTATRTGPVTCAIVARRIDSPLNAVIEIRDQTDRLVAQATDTAGNDTALTFRATENETYTATVYDLDFRGDRSFVYQLTLTEGPRIVTAIPAVGRRGETRPVELVGYGLATGQPQLESVTRDVTFPDDAGRSSFPYQLTTEFGACPRFVLHLSDDVQHPESAAVLTIPCGVTGVLDQRYDEDRYQVSGKKGDVWTLSASSQPTRSQVDPVLTVFDSNGTSMARDDDRSGSTDAALEFRVPADGDYFVSVSDVASASGSKAATYHLSIRTAVPDFQLETPELLNAPIGGTATLTVTAIRSGGFADAIDLRLTGLPDGITVTEPLQLATKARSVKVNLTVAADAAAAAGLVRVTGTTTIGDRQVERSSGPILVATTLKPPFTIDAEGQDDVTKWPRGTTFPAPVLIARDEGFEADIVLEMTSKQGRHRQGIRAPDVVVPNGVARLLYPVYLPEWLETTRTSRMVVNGVAKVMDPQGQERYSVSRQITRMGFLPTGALLKVSAEESVWRVKPGDQLSIPISIDRSVKLTEPVLLELCCDDGQRTLFASEPQNLEADVSQTTFAITIAAAAAEPTEHRLTIRATLLKDGTLPVVAETSVLMEIAN